jgi:purine-nucleoside phosphorylase
VTEGPGVREVAASAAEWFASRTDSRPRLALVLGSGLAGGLKVPRPELEVGLGDVPGLMGPTVSGHPGRLIVGGLHGLDLAVFEGRLHLYEGVESKGVRLVAAFMAAIGVKAVLLTSACGGLSPTLKVGDFVVVRDHVVYPLGGAAWALGRAEELRSRRSGPPGRRRACADSAAAARGGLDGGVYSRELSAALERACMECGAAWSRGVFGYSVGPCYETRAEARALRMAGADVVSMSAAADALAVREHGLEVACLCCVTNAVGLWKRARAGHEEVLAVARTSANAVGAVIDKFVQLISPGGMVPTL